MRYENKSSFDRAFRKLSPQDQAKVYDALNDLYNFFDKKAELSAGLGFKAYGKNYFEVRAGLSTRILFGMKQNLVTFFFVGDHDAIRRFVLNN